MPGILPHGSVRWGLILVSSFNALSALAGGIGLLLPGSTGAPLTLLEGSPFDSYLWPGVILLVVIGGTQALAAVSVVRRARSAPLWAAVAGFALVIWIFVELALLQEYLFLQALYFATGLAQLVLVLALLNILPGLIRPGPSSPTPPPSDEPPSG